MSKSLHIAQMLVPSSKYSKKCPYSMTPTRLVIHNTANTASALNEISYMISNNNLVSFHYAVDEKQAVQGLPLNRNGWHAGDGNGAGNRRGIGIEICRSKSDKALFLKAEDNGAYLAAKLLVQYGWGMAQLTKHQDYSGKYCPHRTLDLGWQRFKNLVQKYYNQIKNGSSSSSSVEGKETKEIDIMDRGQIEFIAFSDSTDKEALAKVEAYFKATKIPFVLVHKEKPFKFDGVKRLFVVDKDIKGYSKIPGQWILVRNMDEANKFYATQNNWKSMTYNRMPD